MGTPNTAQAQYTGCHNACGGEFIIKDTYGDGICCSYGSGSYSVSVNGQTVVSQGGSFGSTEVTEIECATNPTSAPVTPAPVSPAPVTPSPTTAAPVTTSPTTAAPVTPSPTTAAPVTPPTSPPVEPTSPPVEPTFPPVEPTSPPVGPTSPPVEPTSPPVEDEMEELEDPVTFENGEIGYFKSNTANRIRNQGYGDSTSSILLKKTQKAITKKITNLGGITDIKVKIHYKGVAQSALNGPNT